MDTNALPLFAELPPDTVAALLAVAERCAFAPRQVILERSEPSNDLYVVVSGRVSVWVPHPEGRRHVGDISDGEPFGEIAFLDGHRRAADVTALTDVAALRFPRAALLDALAARPEAAAAVYRHLATTLANRLVTMTHMWRDHV